MRAPRDWASLTPALTPLRARFEPSVGIRMCLNIESYFCVLAEILSVRRGAPLIPVKSAPQGAPTVKTSTRRIYVQAHPDSNRRLGDGGEGGKSRLEVRQVGQGEGDRVYRHARVPHADRGRSRHAQRDLDRRARAPLARAGAETPRQSRPPGEGRRREARHRDGAQRLAGQGDHRRGDEEALRPDFHRLGRPRRTFGVPGGQPDPRGGQPLAHPDPRLPLGRVVESGLQGLELAAVFKRIDHVELYTADVERAVRFYTEVLGFTVRSRAVVPNGPHLVSLDLGGTTLELLPTRQAVLEPAPGGNR